MHYTQENVGSILYKLSCVSISKLKISLICPTCLMFGEHKGHEVS